MAKPRYNANKLREQVAIGDKGAFDGMTEAFGPIRDAIEESAPAYGVQEVYVNPGHYPTSSMPPNPYGAPLVGPGRITVPDAYGGREQVNTYRNTRPIFTGKEYLWAVYNVMNVTNRPIRCYTYGDSTVEGGGFIDGRYLLQLLLPEIATAKGVQNYFSVTNRGVGGSNLSTWNPTPDIGVNSANYADLVILKCGINDASFPSATRLEQFKDNLRNGLASIRAVSGGDVGQTAILLVGPNSTIDKEFHARTHEWYEQIRSIFEAACNDFKCAYFDTYQLLQDTGAIDDSLWSRNRWLDVAELPGQDPVALHPRNVGQAWIWGNIMDFIFGPSETMTWSGNRTYARSLFFGHPAAKSPPDWFPTNYAPGVTTEVALTANGFPVDGLLVTVKNPDGFLQQTLTQNNAGGLFMTRTANTTDNFWSPWAGQAVTLSLANGWTNLGGAYGGARITLSSNGVVTLDGTIAPGTTTPGTVLFTVPAGYAPGNQRIMIAASDAGPCQLEVFASGDVQLRSGTPATYLALTGVSYRR